MRRPCGHVAWLAALAWAGPALGAAGDPDAAARAKALYAEANELLAEAKTDEACAKLAESQALVPSVPTLTQLAACQEAEGRLASALASYTQLKVLAGRQLKGARERAVRARMQRLTAKVPHLTVRVAPGALALADLEVRACGEALGRARLGVPLPEDPGSCEVTARAAGRKPWSQTVTLGSRGERVEVVVPALEAEAPAEATTPPAPANAEEAPATAPAEPPPAPRDTGALTERRVTGIALGGLGVALAGTGAYFGWAATQSERDANARCPGTTCADPVALRANDRAETQASLSNLLIGAGAVALVAGVVVLLTARAPAGAAPAAQQGAWIAPTPTGVAGAF